MSASGSALPKRTSPIVTTAFGLGSMVASIRIAADHALPAGCGQRRAGTRRKSTRRRASPAPIRTPTIKLNADKDRPRPTAGTTRSRPRAAAIASARASADDRTFRSTVRLIHLRVDQIDLLARREAKDFLEFFRPEQLSRLMEQMLIPGIQRLGIRRSEARPSLRSEAV